MFHQRLEQLLPPFHRNFPSYKVDAIAWNAAWEETMVVQTPFLMSAARSAFRHCGEATESILLVYRSYYRHLCGLQHDLTLLTTLSMAQGFESQWQATTADVRRDHIVEGHIRVSIAGLEVHRSLCGDITLASLEESDGAGFLKVLKIYLHDDLSSVPTTPITLPYNGTSGIPLPSDEDIWFTIILLDRYFLLYTLQHWKCIPRPVHVKLGKTSFSEDFDTQFMKMMKSIVKPSQVKELKQVMRIGYATSIRTCESCRKPESATMKHMQCKNCAEAQKRRISYCSRQCQKEDWPRHKQFCGKKMTADLARSIVTTPRQNFDLNPSQIQIGPAVQGYTRSPALVAQVYLLNLNPDIDYLIAGPSGDFAKFTFEGQPKLQKCLRTIRDKAVTTGDRSAAAVLGEFLVVVGIRCKLTSGDKLTRTSAMKQLVLEYGEGIERDIHVLEVISFNERPELDAMIQLVNVVNGKEIYDVSVLPHNWDVLESNFQKYGPKRV
ncbi:hypothetical protein Hypma_006447 [Hypsizygus marmoreus]|uniref:MYND-type domain-containing protein n=1 Tax=Hypsizygus marmoreus TaxID=39966 RepID=A0A369JWJ2_HYPMA|nr:hypothetical protein Hypma_006447 [Hypsizygus marmoreus]